MINPAVLRRLLLVGSMLLITGCGLRPDLPAGYEPSTSPAGSGVLFGAYVDPGGQYQEQDRIAAFERFEQQLSRPLAIYQDYHPWADPFPSRSDLYFAEHGRTVLLSWAGTDTRAILSGRDDRMIRQRAQALMQLKSPVMVRWRWEMNRPNLHAEIHSAADYAAAWRHIHGLFVQEHADNVEWVWCPLASSRANPDYQAFYPGDGYVDWLCVDGYAESPSESFQQVFRPFLSWATAIDKPIMIGEFGRNPWVRGTRASWLNAARSYVRRTPQISAIVYFEVGSTAVADDPSSLAALRAWANDPYFSGR